MSLVIDTGVEMTTRDGVVLVADVYRPAAEGSWPTLLHRTPYDRTDPTLVSAIVADPLRLARQGFAVVVQDVRGRFASGGETDFAVQEVDDGYDAVEWAAAQPWSTGDVGIYGSSYHAIAALNAVAARPPHLRAALAMIGGADMAATSWPGGTFELGFLALYSLGQTVDTLRRTGRLDRLADVQRAATDPLGTVSTLPLTAVPVLDDPTVAPAWHDRLAHAPGDPWWHRHPNVHRDPSLVGVPLLQVAAYRDFLSPPMFRLAETLGDPHRFVAGPWAHGGVYTGHTGARVLPDTAGGVGAWGPLIAAWFDRHLRGGEGRHRFLTDDPVHYYLGGENRWTSAASWPPPSSGTRLDLLEEPASIRADPRDPVPTTGGAMSAPPLGPDGIQDQRVLDGRDDVLVLATEPLVDPLTVVGRPRLEVEFSTTAVDADVCVTLVDVEPGGYAVPVAEGAARLRTALGRFVTPDERVAVTVELHDTAHVFRARHRLRVQIAGSSFPRRSRNLHTATAPEQGTLDEAVVATHTVHAATLVS
ncbi:CocE/NonD family hydrolase [Actinomycetospora sp. NBRC 106378]|uniref:CocE/NonD family hydrolase n=1 Tax=Actinomycetospora sp. NBRC 106378 TaxID=3032208 RepID=UPI0024A27DFA|nr:CocE/NonD family hydrolase [Actinomycetospora sp. NBRC 106378]GLZ50384.1 X-Pro dipeptidyl-peptidase [Actinomycetospora sp. NBRC 106378]